ncbi:sulfite exporter TauE/SafE family protein [Kineococcus arenarius]|uniref:sulfite exporter TauE/SafE family protein n=1 Tax=Kineococcus sp. SYSU DK007 TaxID=3383128 RepID=UPI003D7E0322
MILVAGLGALIGLLLGLFGGGGSILAVPALVYGAGVPLAAAVPTSLLVVGISSATAVLPRLRQVQWRLAGVVGGAGAAATFAGAAVNRLLPERWVLLGFALVMIAAGVRMLRHGSDETGASCALPGGGIAWRHCLPRAIGAGVGVGFLTGLFGVGGGFLIIPALTLLLGLSMSTAVPTSLVIVVLNSIFGFTAHVSTADYGTGIDWATAAAFTAAAIAGSLTAARPSGRLPAARLRKGFAYLVFAVAVFVIAQSLLGSTA